MRLDNFFINKVLPKSEILQGTIKEGAKFSVDTRNLKEGDIFIALKGNLSDGHNFLQEALEKKASGLIIDVKRKDLIKNLSSIKDKFILGVDDTYNSLITLAAEFRKQLSLPVIAVTGSVGKTYTKELINKIMLASGKKTYASLGNQNTLIGVALNILQLKETYDVSVFELGISKRGEMAELVDLLQPTYAIINSAGHAHLEGIGSITDVAYEKRQIFKNFKENNVGIINGDQVHLSSVAYLHPVMRFGLKTTNQIQARKIKINENSIDFTLKIYKQKYKIRIPSVNDAYITNILAATSIAVLLEVPNDVIVKTIQQSIEIKGRYNLKTLKNKMGKLIDDCYNANPESMKASLLSFERLKCKGKKIAILSDMKELGTESAFWHRQLGRFLAKTPSINFVILVGNQVKYTSKTVPFNIKFELVESWQDAVEVLNKILEKDSLVLVKGSTNAYKHGIVNIVKEMTVDETNVNDINLIAAIKDTKTKIKTI